MRSYQAADGQAANLVHVDLLKEYDLEKRMNEYEPQEDDIFPQTLHNICTVQ